jgi:putative DNA primase/helicase
MKFSVEDYCSKLGWYLVTIPAGTKGPTKFGWQQPEKALSDPEEARKYYEQNPNHNVGLLHGASGTCAVDIDNVEWTKIIFEELGIDFSEMMQAAPQIIGRENRGKLIFKAPADLITHKISWPVQDDPRKTEVVFELRAGSVQDVLPPSIHPDTGKSISVGRQVNLGWPSRSTPAATYPLGRVGSLETAAHGHLPLEENAKLSAAKQNQTQG